MKVKLHGGPLDGTSEEVGDGNALATLAEIHGESGTYASKDRAASESGDWTWRPSPSVAMEA